MLSSKDYVVSSKMVDLLEQGYRFLETKNNCIYFSKGECEDKHKPVLVVIDLRDSTVTSLYSYPQDEGDFKAKPAISSYKELGYSIDSVVIGACLRTTILIKCDSDKDITTVKLLSKVRDDKLLSVTVLDIRSLQ